MRSCRPALFAFAMAALICAALRAADAPKPAAATQPYVEEGFTSIFNGKDLTGWVYGSEGNARKAGEGYKVDPDQGIVYCTVKDGGNLYTEREYANFILRFEFKLTENANNGIGIRAPLEGDSAYKGMEIQVLDDSGSQYTNLRPAQYHGSIYDCFAAERGHQKPVGEWNQ